MMNQNIGWEFDKKYTEMCINTVYDLQIFVEKKTTYSEVIEVLNTPPFH